MKQHMEVLILEVYVNDQIKSHQRVALSRNEEFVSNIDVKRNFYRNH